MWKKELIDTALFFSFLCGGIYPAGADGLPSRIDLSKPSSYSGVLRIYGNYPDGVAGVTVSSGDVNGDGLDDIVFGSLRADPMERNNAGEVYVVFGSKELKNEDILDMNDPLAGVLRIHGGEVFSQFGRSVAVGDVDGDGYGDIIIGAWNASSEGRQDAGMTYIIFGSPALYSAGVIDVGKPRTDIIAINGQEPGDEFGVLVFSGDVNGDGYDDAIIGAWMADPKGRIGAGRAYVVFGSADMRTRGTVDARDRTRVLAIDGIRASDQLGYHVTSGDMNHDGCDEVIVGARLADPDSLRTDAGEAYIIFGSRNLASRGEIDLAVPQPGIVAVRGAHPGDNVGDRMNTGDVNGDGFDDALIGAGGYDAPAGGNAGVLYILFGSADLEKSGIIDLKSPQNVVTILGEQPESYLSMPFSGDVNHDGFDDVIVTAHSTHFGTRTQVETVYVLFGVSDFRSKGIIDLRAPGMGIVRIDGDDSGGYLGVTGFAGDIDGDRFADIIIGAHGSSPKGRTAAGKVYVIWGNRYVGGYSGHFSFTTATGDSALVLIPKKSTPTISGKPIAPGDEIGIFTPSGLCAGAGTWTGFDLSITVWGDDALRSGINGFRNGEPLSFRIWVKNTDREYPVIPTYASASAAYWSGVVIVLASLTSDVITGANEKGLKSFSLFPNYPNPFNPSTTLSFSLPRTSQVVVAIYNSIGAEVATIVEGKFTEGTHRMVWNAEGFAAGVYFCRMQTGEYTVTRRMLLLK